MPVGSMRRKVIDAATAAAVLLLALGLVFYGRDTSAAAAESIKLCLTVLLPSLFPFFVVSSLAVDTGLASLAGRALEKPMRLLFNVPGACAPAFALGLVGGYPVGAKTAIALYQKGLCSKVQAQRLLAFCNNSGPAFILGAVGGIFGGTAGLLLYGSHILASITVGVLFRGWGGKRRGTDAALPRMRARTSVQETPLRLIPAFTRAVTGAFSSMLNICAFVIFFSVAIRLLCLTGILPGAARGLAALLHIDGDFMEKLLSGALELTSGIYGLLSTGASLNAKLAAAAFMLGWAGVSVHCQVLNFIGESGLSCAPYLAGKMLHGWFSALYVWLGAQLLPFDAQTGPAIKTQLSAMTSRSAGWYLIVSLLTAVGTWAVFALLPALFPSCKARRR